MNKAWWKVLAVTSALLGVTSGCGDSQGPELVIEGNSQHRLTKRQSEDDRKACGNDKSPIPKIRVDSTKNLESLRKKIEELNLDAFLIPSGDSHQSEYVSASDHRVGFISGFSGKGFAIVTKEKAALWTDGRYFLQAEDQLDCNWLFMKGTEGGDSRWITWLGEVLPSGSKIGADATLTGASTWLEWRKDLEKYQFELKPLNYNPIDDIWLDRPRRSQDSLETHELRFAGKSWMDKITDLREKLKESGDDAIVITTLDEIAWLFNLRGKDFKFSPLFLAYAVVSLDEIILYLPAEKQSLTVKNHLNSQGCSSKLCVKLREYTQIFEELGFLSESWDSVILSKKWAYSGGSSFAIYNQIPEEKIRFEVSPVMLLKAQKNEPEINGMLKANRRDAVAVIDMAARLEDGMAAGESWDELKVSMELKKRREEQKFFKSLSFQTISAYGANAAVIHYKPNNKTNTKIGTDSFFLLDSGGQYLDGTTDVSRTFHYGEPTDFQKEAYTRVLLGSIDLARAVFPKGTPDTRLDILARFHLLKVGLNYRHGTGHGIGAYLLIHESPVQVRLYKNEEHPLQVGYFFSDEPGYYQPGEFGVRLETVIRVVKKEGLKLQKKDDYGEMYGFEPVCLVPFEPKLIDFSLFNDEQIMWLNNYNHLIREKVGPLLKSQGKTRALEWMMERTEPMENKKGVGTDGATSLSANAILLNTICLILVYMYCH